MTVRNIFTKCACVDQPCQGRHGWLLSGCSPCPTPQQQPTATRARPGTDARDRPPQTPPGGCHTHCPNGVPTRPRLSISPCHTNADFVIKVGAEGTE